MSKMAEATKTQRLLAAKKLVKEYQKTKKGKTEAKTPVDSLTNSTHSSLNEATNFEENENQHFPINSHSTSPLQQYFSDTAVPQQSAVNFFDNINSKDNNSTNNKEFYNFDHVNFSPRIENHDYIENKINYGDYNYQMDSVAMEDPEIKPNEIYERLHKNDGIRNEDVKQLNEYLSGDKSTVNSSPLSINDSNATKVEENMESLKQLSTQIIQLIDDNSVPDGILQSNCELESKYRETLGCLEEEKLKNARLVEEIAAYQRKVTHLDEIFSLQNQPTSNIDTQQLLQEIERHEQTVKFLVAEKSDLEKLVSQKDAELTVKRTECDEFNARLKTSRSRVADLERELGNLKESKLRKDINIEENEKYVALLQENQNLKSRNDEMTQDISELQQKLHDSAGDNLKLRNEIEELTSELSLVKIKLQQVSVGDDSQRDIEMKNMLQRAHVLDQQNAYLNNLITNINNEKEQAALQYQQYVQQLNCQLNNLAQKLEEKSQENETLIAREQQLTTQMGELEKLLQNYQNEPMLVKSGSDNAQQVSENAQRLLEMEEAVRQINEEKAGLEAKLAAVVGDRDETLKDLEMKRDELMQLEDMMSHLRSNQPDNVKLLAELESARVGASRAVAQNEELKSQLEEMQNVFIRLSNEKLELTEQLINERHKTKDIQEQLTGLTSQIHTLTDAIAIKDKEMLVLRESAGEVDKYVMQQNQLEDRLRHYEAQEHSTHALQHELQQSYQRIQTLTTENNSLKLNMKNLEDKFNNLQSQTASIEGVQNVVVSEENSVLLEKISNLEKANKELELKLEERNKIERKTIEEEMIEKVNNPHIDEIKITHEIAMTQLEEKFTKMMKEIADLEDEKQRLEHLVLQLQDETETIGEYVTLYQYQRGILKQKTSEKEDQMRQLAVDREQMKEKIDQLNQLVNRLVVERGDIAIEALQQNVDQDKLCSEHAKVHQELKTSDNQEEYNNNTKTAEKIFELLGEIKTSSLVQPSESGEMFHACPWCSGQLITV